MKKTFTLLFTSIFAIATVTVTAQINFQWAKKISGPDTQQGMGISTDANGNVYHCGIFYDTVDFDPSAGTTTLTALTSGSGYVTKFDGNGNLIWATSIPGPAYKVASDAAGNVFVSGIFTGTQDFDSGSGTTTLTPASTNYADMYICKFDNNGTFVSAGSISGPDAESARSMTTDASGNVIIAGIFKNTVDFDPSATTTHTIAGNGSSDGFVLKLDNSCNFLWAAAFGSAASLEEASDVAVDAAGDLYITGVFGGSVDFDPGVGYNYVSPPGTYNVYLLKLDAAGNFGWVKNYSTYTNGYPSIALDATGNIYIASNYTGTVDFDPSAGGTTSLTSVGADDCCISKFDASGNFIFVKGFGSTSTDYLKDIKVANDGTIYYTGIFYQTADFDPSTTGTYTLTSAGANDAFIGAISAAGNFLWAGKLQPYSYDIIGEIAVNTSGDFYACGSFMFTTDFDPSSTVSNLTADGTDAFIMKIRSATAGLMDRNNIHNQISIFPNPFSNTITLNTNTTNLDNAQLTITDVLGKTVKQIANINGNHPQINLEEFNNGIYFYTLTEKSITLSTGKLIKN